MPVRKVLVVDDDEGVRMLVAAVMETEGWTCVEARNGLEGFELAESEQPDLIMLDLTMPVMDGFEAFRRLRESALTDKIPIIIMTAFNDERENAVRYTAEDLEDAFNVPRPEGFVDKPFAAAHLRRCILGVVG